jgi:hypothetical protein
VGAGLLIADVMKVFNPQSTQARAIFDLAIVVIAVLVSFLRSSLASRGKTAGLPDSFLLATAAQGFFLDCRAEEK